LTNIWRNPQGLHINDLSNNLLQLSFDKEDDMFGAILKDFEECLVGLTKLGWNQRYTQLRLSIFSCSIYTLTKPHH